MTTFQHDTTIRWPCRSGDYLLWAGFKGIMTLKTNSYKGVDIWALHGPLTRCPPNLGQLS